MGKSRELPIKYTLNVCILLTICIKIIMVVVSTGLKIGYN